MGPKGRFQGTSDPGEQSHGTATLCDTTSLSEPAEFEVGDALEEAELMLST